MEESDQVNTDGGQRWCSGRKTTTVQKKRPSRHLSEEIHETPTHHRTVCYSRVILIPIGEIQRTRTSCIMTSHWDVQSAALERTVSSTCMTWRCVGDVGAAVRGSLRACAEYKLRTGPVYSYSLHLLLRRMELWGGEVPHRRLLVLDAAFDPAEGRKAEMLKVSELRWKRSTQGWYHHVCGNVWIILTLTTPRISEVLGRSAQRTDSRQWASSGMFGCWWCSFSVWITRRKCFLLGGRGSSVCSTNITACCNECSLWGHHGGTLEGRVSVPTTSSPVGPEGETSSVMEICGQTDGLQDVSDTLFKCSFIPLVTAPSWHDDVFLFAVMFHISCSDQWTLA